MTTPLCLAMEKIHGKNNLLPVVELLLNFGANPNIHNKYEPTPLTTATKNGSLKIMKVLIDSNAKLEARDDMGRTALFNACSKKTVKFLLEAGANINAKDRFGQTALFHTTEEQAEALIDAGLDFRIKDKSGKTALFSANLEVTKLLLKLGADPNETDKIGLSPLFYNGYHQKVSVFKELIDAGAILNKVYPRDRTPLIYAIKNNGADVIELFVERGADVNLNDDFQSPLEVVMKHINGKERNVRINENDWIKILKMLLEAGANPNITTYYDTPIWEYINSREVFDIFDKYADFDEVTRQQLLRRFRQ